MELPPLANTNSSAAVPTPDAAIVPVPDALVVRESPSEKLPAVTFTYRMIVPD